MSSTGTVDRTDDGRYVISFERRIAHPPRSVWDALTRPEELIRWWGEAEVDLTEGGRFRIRWLNEHEGEHAVMEATIALLVPERLLVLDGDIHGRLRWELTPEGDATLLSFRSTTELQPDYLTLVPAGWHFHLDALADHLDGDPADLVDIEERWQPIHQLYVAAGGEAPSSPRR